MPQPVADMSQGHSPSGINITVKKPLASEKYAIAKAILKRNSVREFPQPGKELFKKYPILAEVVAKGDKDSGLLKLSNYLHYIIPPTNQERIDKLDELLENKEEIEEEKKDLIAIFKRTKEVAQDEAEKQKAEKALDLFEKEIDPWRILQNLKTEVEGQSTGIRITKDPEFGKVKAINVHTRITGKECTKNFQEAIEQAAKIDETVLQRSITITLAPPKLLGGKEKEGEKNSIDSRRLKEQQTAIASGLLMANVKLGNIHFIDTNGKPLPFNAEALAAALLPPKTPNSSPELS